MLLHVSQIELEVEKLSCIDSCEGWDRKLDFQTQALHYTYMANHLKKDPLSCKLLRNRKRGICNNTQMFPSAVYSRMLLSLAHVGFHARLVCFTGQKLASLILALLGVWNLDFLHFVIPPLCVSTSLKLINILLFDYIAT